MLNCPQYLLSSRKEFIQVCIALYSCLPCIPILFFSIMYNYPPQQLLQFYMYTVIDSSCLSHIFNVIYTLLLYINESHIMCRKINTTVVSLVNIINFPYYVYNITYHSCIQYHMFTVVSPTDLVCY